MEFSRNNLVVMARMKTGDSVVCRGRGKNVKFTRKARRIVEMHVNRGMILSNVSLYLLVVATNLVL